MNIRKFRQQLNKLVKEYTESVKTDNRWDLRMYLAEAELLDWAQTIQHTRHYPEDSNG